MLIPSHKRTLIINYKPYFLTLPPIQFDLITIEEPSRWLRARILIDNIYYYLPLPNINLNGILCLGIITKNYRLERLIELFFTSPFYFGHIGGHFNKSFLLYHRHIDITQSDLERYFNDLIPMGKEDLILDPLCKQLKDDHS